LRTFFFGSSQIWMRLSIVLEAEGHNFEASISRGFFREIIHV
jgi:hypothetical protein